MKVIIRPQLIGDTDHVRALLTDAFADGGRVATLAEALLDGPSRAALVAEVDGEVVGHVQLARSWLDAPRALVEVRVLSPLGVAPEWQGQGVGALLVQEAMERAEATGAPLVWLEGWPDYYFRFGFTRGVDRGFRAPSDRIPAPAFQVATLPAWQPWMVGGLVLPDTFWVHDMVGLRDLD
ncbi:MAG TPA: N-acetyltransferase [Jatrophihabitans sp.]|nr:N-acetyltransferase [Jatrophihabitans sp.]